MDRKTHLLARIFVPGGPLLVLVLILVPGLVLAHAIGAFIPSPPVTTDPTNAARPENNPGSTRNASSTAGVTSINGVPGYQHVFLIMMENADYNGLLGNANAPWINFAARTYGLATSYYGVSHPSQPNYLALTSGSTHGVASDGNVVVHAPNLVDQLEAHNKTWKAYMQSLFSNGNTNKLASWAGNYARKHDPFVSYADIRDSPARMERIVDFHQFATDLANNTAPDFAWISPDVCHDMHGRSSARPGDPCSSQQEEVWLGDTFLSTIVHEIMHSSSWTGNSVIFITWDESFTSSNTTSGCCGVIPGGGHVLTLVISHEQRAPLSSHIPYNHYSLLATIEQGWRLGCQVHTCDTVHVHPMDALLP